MSKPKKAPKYLWRLFIELRRRHFLLSLQDYDEVRRALRLGFGWESKQDFLNLLCCLWAKSKAEQEILITLFKQDITIPDWELPLEIAQSNPSSPRDDTVTRINDVDTTIVPITPSAPTLPPSDTPQIDVEEEPDKGLPLIPREVELPEFPLIMVPEYPVSEREIAQSWRRLRRPVRIGPAIELDIDATIARRVQQGIVVDVVFRPRRRNASRLLLLVDQYGSMTPFRQFVEMVCHAIRHISNFQNTELYYFHDVPVCSNQFNDTTLLEPVSNMLFPVLDRILPDIQPSTSGKVSDDLNSSQKYLLQDVLDKYASGAAIVIISDAGAARGNYDFKRLFDTVSFLKALNNYTKQIVWLNPVQCEDWKYGTVKQIQRYIPMFEMNRDGFYRAVDVLRGHPYLTDQQL